MRIARWRPHSIERTSTAISTELATAQQTEHLDGTVVDPKRSLSKSQHPSQAATSIDAVVVGAGQAGLAISRRLSEHGVDHVVFERNEVAHSWKHERWDSLRLLTPNWMTRLPGGDPQTGPRDDFDTAADVAAELVRYAERIAAPVSEHCEVTSVRSARIDEHDTHGFTVAAGAHTWLTRAVSGASGGGVSPSRPPFAALVPQHVTQLDPFQYRSPAQLPSGRCVVVGASASGVQLADEIARAGREVVLCVGEHRRMLRSYRGRDIFWWMDAVGILDEPAGERAHRRPPPSMQLIGTPEHRHLDLNSLQDLGVSVVGRMTGVEQGIALVADTLDDHCAASDAALFALLERFEQHALDHDLHAELEPADPVDTTRVPDPVRSIDLDSVTTIVWATGFTPSFEFLDPDWLDERGAVRHDLGIGCTPGLYVTGVPYARRTSSNFISGVGDDAAAIADHLAAALDRVAHRRAVESTAT